MIGTQHTVQQLLPAVDIGTEASLFRPVPDLMHHLRGRGSLPSTRSKTELMCLFGSTLKKTPTVAEPELGLL